MSYQKIKKALVTEYNEKGEILQEDKIISEPIPQIRNNYNSRFYPKHYEVNNSPSLTIPDQAMTVMELMQRFASGLPISGAKVPIYEEEEGELSAMHKMDLTERQDYIKEKMEEVKEITDRVNIRKQQAAEKRLEKIITERIKLKANEKETPTN